MLYFLDQEEGAMEKLRLIGFWERMSLFSLFSFILTLIEKKSISQQRWLSLNLKREDFSGGPGDNFPYLGKSF